MQENFSNERHESDDDKIAATLLRMLKLVARRIAGEFRTATGIPGDPHTPAVVRRDNIPSDTKNDPKR